MHWGQAMANLSDLLANNPDHAQPGWVAILGTSRGFVDRPLAMPRPDAVSAEQPDQTARHAGELEEAYRRGHADGQVAAAACQTEQDAARVGLALHFARLDEAARQALAERLTQGVAQLCEQVIAPALIDRAALAQRCAALAQLVGDAANQCTLHLHPDDAALLDPGTRACWPIAPDPALPRGSLLLEHADGAVADGPEEWRRLIAGALSA